MTESRVDKIPMTIRLESEHYVGLRKRVDGQKTAGNRGAAMNTEINRAVALYLADAASRSLIAATQGSQIFVEEVAPNLTTKEKTLCRRIVRAYRSADPELQKFIHHFVKHLEVIAAQRSKS